jgi:hypothetical protein
MILAGKRSLHDLCGRLAAQQAPHLPFYAAAAAGRINIVVPLDHQAAWPGAEIERSTRPVAVLIGDDPEIGNGEAVGPHGWACARRLRYWRPRGAIVHGAAGTHNEYRLAAEAAELSGRFVLVETSAAMVDAWVHLLRDAHPLVILPRSGVHPVLPAMGARH